MTQGVVHRRGRSHGHVLSCRCRRPRHGAGNRRPESDHSAVWRRAQNEVSTRGARSSRCCSTSDNGVHVANHRVSTCQLGQNRRVLTASGRSDAVLAPIDHKPTLLHDRAEPPVPSLSRRRLSAAAVVSVLCHTDSIRCVRLPKKPANRGKYAQVVVQRPRREQIEDAQRHLNQDDERKPPPPHGLRLPLQRQSRSRSWARGQDAR